MHFVLLGSKYVFKMNQDDQEWEQDNVSPTPQYNFLTENFSMPS